MAILSKIRERSVFLILIIGLALLAFVLDPSSIQSFFQANKQNAVGEVNGEMISREDFANEVETYKARYGTAASSQVAMNYAWDKLVGEAIYADQLNKAGVVVGEEDVWTSIISMPFFNNNPQFQNEVGLFDQEKVKEYIASLKDDAINAPNGSPEKNIWINWLRTEGEIRKNLQKSSLDNLVTVGLGASLKEGERNYSFNNDKVTSKLVYVPYTSIPDSSVVITNSEYQAYINEHAKEFEVDESRDINYVKFNVVASEADKEAIEANVAKYIDDREEYSNAAKTTITVQGLRNASDIAAFLEEAKSDLPVDTNFVYKSKLATVIADTVFNSNVGDVVGPYEDNGYYKIAKIAAFKQMPDSVKSRHIIVPYIGTVRNTSIKSREDAKKTIDSIYALVRNSSSKFIAVADEINSDGSKGKGGDIGWITKDAAFSPNFDIDFANYLYNNKKGTVQVVETKYGFHIIKIDDVKNIQKAVQLVTLARQIVPSVETENKFYQDAETLTSDLVNGGDIFTLAEEHSYNVLPAIGLKVLDENVPGILNSQRQIVSWTFNADTEVNDVRRFDIENGHIVAVLSQKTQKGLAPVSNVINRIRPILLNDKKAELLFESMTGDSLEAIANSSGTNVRTANNVTLASPTISGVGAEPAIVGAMMGATVGELINKLKGAKGVFAIQVSSTETAPELPNYESSRKRISDNVKTRTSQIYTALKSSYDVEDYRSTVY